MLFRYDTAPPSHFIRYKYGSSIPYTSLRAWFRKSRCSRDQLHMRFIIMALGTSRLCTPYAESLKQRPTDNVPPELRNLIWSRHSNYSGCYLCHENMIRLASRISISPRYLLIYARLTITLIIFIYWFFTRFKSVLV